MWKPESDVRRLPLLLSLIFEIGHITRYGDRQFGWTGQPVSSRELACLCFPGTEITDIHCHTGFSYGYLGSEPKFSCLHGQHFPEPSPQLTGCHL